LPFLLSIVRASKIFFRNSRRNVEVSCNGGCAQQFWGL
jgi:hypothetical protein